MTRSASEALKSTTFKGLFPAIVFESCESIYCHFEEENVDNGVSMDKSFLELHVHFNGFVCIRMRKVHAGCQIQANACD